MRVTPIDIYENGNLVRIEFVSQAGDFEMQAIWDENDEQTPINRLEFRKWAYHMVRQAGYEVNA